MKTEVRYLLDAVSISRMSEAYLLSDFVKKNCNISGEVLCEISENPNYENLKSLEIEVSPGTLKWINNIFQDERFDWESIVDLFSNEGNGDVLILATILAQRERESYSLGLYSTSWVIVTDDIGLMEAAKKIDIDAIGTDEFKSRIDKS